MEHHQGTQPNTEVGPTARLGQIRRELHSAAYPKPDIDRLHALEDEAADLLGVRTVRQARDVVSNVELYRLLGCAVRNGDYSQPLIRDESCPVDATSKDHA